MVGLGKPPPASAPASPIAVPQSAWHSAPGSVSFLCVFSSFSFFPLFFTLFLFFPGRELILTEQTKQEATAN